MEELLNTTSHVECTLPPPLPADSSRQEKEELKRRRHNQEARILTGEETQRLRSKLLAASYHHGGSDLDQLFDQYDKDKNGFIDAEELASLVRKLIPHVTAKEMGHLFTTLDVDGSSSIDRFEFVAFVKGKESTVSAKKGPDSPHEHSSLVSSPSKTSTGAIPLSSSKDSLNGMSETGQSSTMRQPAASARKLQQAYHEKELLLQEVMSLKEQLRKIESSQQDNSSTVAAAETDSRMEVVVNANIKLGTQLCLWCIKYNVLKLKSRAFKKWCVVCTAVKTASDVSTDKVSAPYNGDEQLVDPREGVQGVDVDKKRRQLLSSAKSIMNKATSLSLVMGKRSGHDHDYDEEERIRRAANQKPLHLTGHELENLKHRILAASYKLGNSDLKTFFDRIDKDRSERNLNPNRNPNLALILTLTLTLIGLGLSS